MHFQIPVILAFGAGLVSTMALPTADNSTLEKRSHYGWVGSFASPSCAGKPDPNGANPKIPSSAFGSNCVKFEYVVGDAAIGINYGSGLYEYGGVNFFSDGNCEDLASLNGWRTVAPGPDGTGCVEPAPGTVVNSFQAVSDVSPT